MKTGFVGFLTASRPDLVINGPLTFLLGYKFSQDHLELFNGAIRSALGANNNQTCKQFESIFRRLLVKLELRNVRGNCTSLGDTILLSRGNLQPKIRVIGDREEEPSGELSEVVS